MKQYYTSVDIAPSTQPLGYQDSILLLGSCFADNIGAKFQEYYFRTTINPFGTLYNPASIARAIACATQPSEHPIKLIEHNGLWHSMMHHGMCSAAEQSQAMARCQTSVETLQQAIGQATTLVVTFGTAWVYEMDGEVVANCHKIPANRFVRRCLTVEEIVEMWQPIVASMSDKHWIFTVSPIRHIKDGLHENQISKAILLQAIDELISRMAPQKIRMAYFPSYEIMLDELRDYRFYAEDMVHPSEVAVEHIWQRFVACYMPKNTQEEMRQIHQLWRDRNHRFLHPESEEAKAFVKRTEEKRQLLEKTYPWIR